MIIKNYLQKFLPLTFSVILFFSACKKEIEVQPDEAIPPPKIALRSDLLMASKSSVGDLNGSSSILKLGINGHLGDAPYLKVPWAQQIAMIKERGMSYYRINVQTKADGSASSSIHLNALQKAADAAGVKLLPMLYLRTLDYDKSEAENYKMGKNLGGRFASKYGKYFVFYNLGNDEELPIIYRNKTGIKPEHYDPIKFKATAAYLKGMDEGIKANDPDAKTLIGAGWLHFGFLQMCNDYGIKYDRIAYNWYSDMENAAPKAPYFITDITQTLTTLFPDKPIWFTEYNYRYKALSLTNERDQDEFVNRFTAKCRANPNVKVAIIYELFDEPYKSVQESAYGIIKWKNHYDAWEDKLLSKTFLSNLLQ
jgi:hypothetical protein